MLALVEQNDADRFEIEDRIKKRTFATHYAYGTPLVKAMRLAGFDMPSKARAVHILRDTYVQEEMEKCFAELRKSLTVSREAVVAQLDDAIELAHNLEQPAAVIAGVVAKAKVLGLMDKAAQGNMPSKITVEWGEESSETIYEKSNPILFDAVTTVVESEGAA